MSTPAGEKVFLRSAERCANACVCVCTRGIPLCWQTLSPVRKEHERKTFLTDSAQGLGGVLWLSPQLFTGGRKVRGGLSLLKVGDAGEEEENETACLLVFLFSFQHFCTPLCLYPIPLSIHLHTVSLVAFYSVQVST